jgi:hypothetical protein
MCSSFCEKIHNIRVLWNELAFKSSLCSLSIRFYNFGTPPCLSLTWGSDMSRSISGHNMNTSIGLHIRSTSGVSRANHRIQQFLKNCEAHMRKILCPNSTVTRAVLFRVVKQWTKHWAQISEQRFACQNPSRWTHQMACGCWLWENFSRRRTGN